MSTMIEQQLRTRARDLLATGEVELFVGYRQGSSPLRVAPFVARGPAEAERLVWNGACLPNLAGTLKKHNGRRVGVVLKACDAHSVVELLKLNQLSRERLYIIGLACDGMVEPARIASAENALSKEEAELLINLDGASIRQAHAELLPTKCAGCAGPPPSLADEWLGAPMPTLTVAPAERFRAVRELEARDPAARLAFWSEHLSRCTLCYACQSICPLCYCKQCALTLARDDPRRQAREPASIFAFHLMRATHLAGRCTGCDECERVCPEEIPLSLICRKLELDRLEQPGLDQVVDPAGCTSCGG
jgi:formate dehydrogenase (coenzyme F420) beta subunit